MKLCQVQADLYKAKANNLYYMGKRVGEVYPKWYMYSAGLGFISLIMLLSLGPMFLFSSFNIFGEINSAKNFKIRFDLEVMSENG